MSSFLLFHAHCINPVESLKIFGRYASLEESNSKRQGKQNHTRETWCLWRKDRVPKMS
ncbi:hypothetical protein AYX15_07030 [Cryptococcus neoformans]|nr:hypothetical protein AYX15_07030 [Cryptococcus neoformans var. grubii]